jgi:hypothetical protein
LAIFGWLISIQRPHYVGGRLDPEQFLKQLVKKHTDAHIEVEIKLKEVGYFSKILQWIKKQPHTAENTINRIWHMDGKNMIETIDMDDMTSAGMMSAPKYSSKKRLFKYDVPLGKLTVSLEEGLGSDKTDYDMFNAADPAIVRIKRRLSANINDNWRVDYTRVNVADVRLSATEVVRTAQKSSKSEMIEVEFEYIGEDVEGSFSCMSQLVGFIGTL